MALGLDALLSAESLAFRRAIMATEPSDPVPTCPDWNADDLLWHLGEVQHFWATIVRERMTDPAAYPQPARPDGRPGLLEFFDQSHAALVDALATSADHETAWTWFGADQTVGFTRRRQVHEALIHRIDAEIAAGVESVVDPELAADGVDEVLTIMFGGVPEWADTVDRGEIGEVRCTDVDRRWLVQVARFGGTSPNTGTTYSDEPILTVVATGDPAFEIAGAAVDLDRWFWNRHPQGSVHRGGDTSAVDGMVDDGMQ